MKTMTKVLVFDMDDTLNQFYAVPNWLEDLHNESVRPYIVTEPKYDMEYLGNLLNELKVYGYIIAITTWLAKNATREYDNKVRKAKLEWLEKYQFPYDRISMVRYGTTKANSTRKLKGYQVLFDDNDNIRKGWTLGDTVDAKDNILPFLENLLKMEKEKI